MKRRSFFQQVCFFAASVVSIVGFSANQLSFSNRVEAAPAVTEINFGILSTESQANQKRLLEPFIADMSKAIGIPVKPFYATQYAGVVEGMRFGKVQVAWLGGKSYIEAVKHADY